MSDHKTREYGGFQGKSYFSRNAVRIELGKSFNGSGKSAFGGAKDWPTLRVTIPFQVGEEKRMERVADRIGELLEDEYVISPHGCRVCGTKLDFATICPDCLPQAVEERKQSPDQKWCIGCGRHLVYGHVCDKCASILDLTKRDSDGEIKDTGKHS